jgi:hypothetical protein
MRPREKLPPADRDGGGANGHRPAADADVRYRVRVDLPLPLPARAPAPPKDSQEEQREAREDDLDAAVGTILERMAAEEAWDATHPSPEDPYAPKVGVRMAKLDGERFLAVHVDKRTPAEDFVRVEYLKKLGKPPDAG